MNDKLLDDPAQRPDRILVGADELTFRAVSSATGGDALAFDVVMQSGGGPPPIAGGLRHTIRNESAEVAQAYVVFTPGTAMEAFTREAATLGGDVPAVLALAERCGIEMTGPVEVTAA